MATAQLGYKEYDVSLGSGTLDSRVSFTGLDYALFSVTIPTVSAPILIVNQYYRVDFTDGGTTYVTGVYKYGGKQISGSDTIFYFAYYGMVYLDTVATTGEIYDASNVIITSSGVSANGDVRTTTKQKGWYIGKETIFDGEIVFSGDAYETLMDIKCTKPRFYVWINYGCADGIQTIELEYEFFGVEINENTCTATAKPNDNDFNIPEEFDIRVNVMGTGASRYEDFSFYFTRTIPTNAVVSFQRFLWLGDIMNYLISVSKAKVVGFRSILLNVNSPSDYTYTQVVPFSEYETSPAYSVHIFIAGMADMMRPDASQYQTVLMMTIKDLLNNICKLYNCLYFIDDDGYLRVEHMEYFENIGQRIGDDLIDVRKYTFTEKAAQAKQIEYKYRYMYDGSDYNAFGIGTIVYSLNNGQYEKPNVDPIDDCGADWMAVLKMNDPTWVGPKWVEDDIDAYFIAVMADHTNSTPPNHLVFMYSNSLWTGLDFLIRSYHRHNVPYPEIYVPKEPTRDTTEPTNEVIDELEAIEPLSFSKDAEAEELVITECCQSDYNIGDYVLTTKGNAEITDMAYDIRTQTAKIQTRIRICP